MEEKYQAKEILVQAEIIKEGNYYAALLQDEWYRIKVLSSDLGNKFCVSLIDHGDTDEVPSECIFPLDDEFIQLPAQVKRLPLILST